MPLTLKDLTTPPTEEELLNQFLAVLLAGQFPVTQWQSGGLARTLAKLVAKGVVSLATLVSNVALGGFNSTATGAWLTLLSREVFQNTRAPATFTAGTINLALSSALAGPYTLVAGQLWFRWNGKNYRNTSGGPLSFASPLTVSFKAESPGASYNAPDNALTLVTPLAGASITASLVTTQGANEETDTSLRSRNSGKWGTVGSAANSAGYAAWAREASTQVTRVRVRENFPVDGTVTLRLAGPSGGVDSSVEHAVYNFIEPLRALCVTVNPESSAEQTVAVSGAIRVTTGHPNAGNALAQAIEALAALFAVIDEGGTVFLGDLYAAIEAIPGVANALLTAPASDTVLSSTRVPVLDSSGLSIEFI